MNQSIFERISLKMQMKTDKVFVKRKQLILKSLYYENDERK